MVVSCPMWALRTEAASPGRASALNYPAPRSRGVELLIWFLFVCLHLASFPLLAQTGLNWKRGRQKGRKLGREEARLIYFETLLKRCTRAHLHAHNSSAHRGNWPTPEHPLLSAGHWFLRREFLCISTKHFLSPHRTAFRESGAMHSPVRKDPYF